MKDMARAMTTFLSPPPRRDAMARARTIYHTAKDIPSHIICSQGMLQAEVDESLFQVRHIWIMWRNPRGKNSGKNQNKDDYEAECNQATREKHSGKAFETADSGR
jgi:hypothetical protein